jgi:hypothetical protein
VKWSTDRPIRCAITGLWFHPEDPELRYHGIGKQASSRSASRATSRNSKKIREAKKGEDRCRITNQPFSEIEGAQKSHGDHCHKTMRYRGACWAVANRTLGGIEYMMENAGMTLDEVLLAIRVHLVSEGVDIGLEQVPRLGKSEPGEVDMVQ